MSERLTRSVDFTVLRAEDDGDGLTLEGYAATFNTPTDIDSWEGRFTETIAPGAFKRTIDRKGPARIRLQFDHGQHPLIGSIPIGSIRELREDGRGLFVSARLFDNDLVKPVRDAIAGGAIAGMSFQFRVVNDEWDEDGDRPTRTIREVELFELGPVVWPAYETTTVGVRAAEVARDLANDQDFRQQVASALLTAGTSDQPATDVAPGSASAVSDAPPSEGARRASEAQQKLRRQRLRAKGIMA